MELSFWWMPLLWVFVIAGVVALAFVLTRRRMRRRPARAAVPVAHTERLTALPAYRRALTRYRTLLALSVAAVVVALVAAVVLSARPVAVSAYQPELRNRDIVLCLDVSGSMVDYDAEIVDTFSDLVDEFDGERIGLVLFNASAATAFPLTSDYAFVEDQLSALGDKMRNADEDYSFANGTLLGNGSSLIGDGLGSCVMRFDDIGQERSRSIILATDNFVAGEQIVTLPEAGEFATENDVTVYGINPGDVASKSYIKDLADEFEKVVDDTGGAYYALDDPGAIPAIVEQIQSEQAADMTGATQIVKTDIPVWPIVAGLFGTAALMFLGWRLKR